MSKLKTPAEAVAIDWDHNAPAAMADLWDRLNHLAAEAPIAWNTTYGGFWVVSGYEQTRAAYEDWETFSSLHDGVEDDPFALRDIGQYPEGRSISGGISIPAQQVRFVPTEADGGMHAAVRRLEAPFFTPKVVRSHEDFIRTATIEAIERVRATGRIDFVNDLANVVPPQVASQLIGGGTPDWKTLAKTVHQMLVHPMSSPGFPWDDFRSMQRQILALVTLRRDDPQQDVASALMQGSIFDVPLEPGEAQTILNGLTFGSTDTTATTLAHTVRWLSDNPEVRDRLRVSPELIPGAIEEFLRLYTPGLGIGRTIARDAEFFGYELREGQRALLLGSAANRDPREFPDPLMIKFDRENVRNHLAFAAGPHRCLGAPYAKLELKIMLEELLQRIPDWTVVADETVEYPIKNGTLGFDRLPARFTPSREPAVVPV